jgi:hypothetical protein
MFVNEMAGGRGGGAVDKNKCKQVPPPAQAQSPKEKKERAPIVRGVVVRKRRQEFLIGRKPIGPGELFFQPPGWRFVVLAPFFFGGVARERAAGGRRAGGASWACSSTGRDGCAL